MSDNQLGAASTYNGPHPDAHGNLAAPPTERRWQPVEGRPRLLPPIQSSKVVCIGLNYRDHIAEIGLPEPEEPLVFLKPPSALIGHRVPIIRPPAVDRVDYEGELAVVIGRACRNAAAEDALDFVAGLTIANDVTARDYQTPGSQWTKAKGYDTFAPIGPCVIDSREWSGRRITTTLNGALVQSSSTDQLIFGVPDLIAHISRVMTLEPGDVILTGTPSGVGNLAVGDLVEVTIEGIGTLSNPVQAPNEDAHRVRR